MQKIIVAFARFLVFLGWCISQLQLKERQIFGRVATEKDIDAFIEDNRITTKLTPYGLSYTILRSFHWKEDMLCGFFDFAKHPYVFLHDKEDDCDGFAIFCEYICNKVGFKNVSVVYVVDIIALEGHAVAIVNFPKYGYTICGNWSFIVIEEDSFSAIANVVRKEILGDTENPLLCLRYIQNKYLDSAIITTK